MANIVIMSLLIKKLGNSAIHIFWYHNKNLVIDEKIKTITNRNLKSFLIDCIISELKLENNHQLSIQELVWWFVINN